MFRKKGEQKGFTLIEVIATLAIIGMLAGVATPVYLNQTKKGREVAAKSAISGVQTKILDSLTATRGAPTEQIAITTTSAVEVSPVTWVAKTAGNVEKFRGTFESSGPVTGTVFTNGSWCVAQQASSGETFVAKSDSPGTIIQGQVCPLTELATGFVLPSGSAATVPSKPSNLVASSPSNNRVDISWGAVTGAVSYTVRLEGKANKNISTLNTNFTDVEQGNHRVDVSAINSHGNRSPWATSNEVQVSTTCAKAGGLANTCVLGDTGPGGGKVFYVDNTAGNGSRYMEAAAAPGWAPPVEPTMEWGLGFCVGRNSGATGTAVGTGSANTTAITTACNVTQAPAAWMAKSYNGGGVSWFLPSKDELNELYTRRAIVGGFASDFYWSSSQNSPPDVWIKRFVDGTQLIDAKDNAYRVRPVRAF